MARTYSQRSLAVLLFLGLLSAVMALLSLMLVFQLQSHSAAMKESSPPPPPPPPFPAEVCAVLVRVSAVLAALSLTLNLSSVLVCLLHTYFTTEMCCAGEDHADRADWFLLDSRAVRHVAVGLFCLGVCVYLAAMSIYMLLVFEIETGIASACVLASGVLVLLITVAHTLVWATSTARHYRNELPDTMYRNDHDSSPGVHPSDRSAGDKSERCHRGLSGFQRQFSYPLSEPKQHPCASQSHTSDNKGYGSSSGSVPRMHRTLSAESGLLQAQSQPWNGINSEMRKVLARKSANMAKDSTLV
ncbi:transmembrane protein 221 [Scleropages formosus]|uniref:Transmembrane protein 221 n=1 Tax=Scleropages formosus TaxID=113540 RepID=A0A8C9RB81_SCLFO|nr:transmembrane protein 221 [Scleropages formosus]